MSESNDVDQVEDQVDTVDELTADDVDDAAAEVALEDDAQADVDDDESVEVDETTGEIADEDVADEVVEDAADAADEEPAEAEDPLEAFRRELWAKPGDWFVVHTYSGMEKRVKHNLENRIISLNMEDYIHEIVVPTEEVAEIKNGQRKMVKLTVLQIGRAHV